MNLDKSNIDNLIVKSSFVGLLVLYFIKIRYDRKEAFNKTDLQKIRSGDYTYGYFVACSSFNVFEYTSNKDIFNITNFNQHLSNSIKTAIYERAKKHDDLGLSPKWSDDVRNVETL